MTSIKSETEIYKKLLVDTLPGIIETEEENERALEIVNSLMSKGEDNLSIDERRLLALIVRLIEDFEEGAYTLPEKVSPLDSLRFLMMDLGLKQKDLIDIFGSQSIVSDILNKKREINKTHARRLADRFNLPVGLFV